MNKHLVITGVERSGTSCMMGAIREAGIPIGGFKFPVQSKVNDQYVDGGMDEIPDDPRTKIHPFWEYTSMNQVGLVREMGGYGIKCLFPLMKSNPDLVDKVIFMLRHPVSVLQSQRRIVTGADKFSDEAIFNEIAVKWSGLISWIQANKKEMLVVDYDDLVANPITEMTRVTDFVQRGDPEWGAKYIDENFKHFNPQDYKGSPSGERLFARLTYEKIKNGEYDKVLQDKQMPQRIANANRMRAESRGEDYEQIRNKELSSQAVG